MVSIVELYVGAVVSLNLALSVRNAHRVGEDQVARQLAKSAHGRMDSYLQDDHDGLEADGGERNV